jgi:hypothetical protein
MAIDFGTKGGRRGDMAPGLSWISWRSVPVLLRHPFAHRLEALTMKLARHGLDDPQRLVELEQQLEEQIVETIAQAGDAGYSAAEVLIALKLVCERPYTAQMEYPDPVDDPV